MDRDGRIHRDDEHDGTPPRPICPGDVTLDGTVDITDLLAVVDLWGQLGGTADLDWNGVVDIGDLLEVIAGFGDCTLQD